MCRPIADRLISSIIRPAICRWEKLLKSFIALVSILLLALLSGCAGGLGVTAADYRPGDVVGDDKFVAFLSVVRTTQTADAALLKLRRHQDDGTTYDYASYDGRDLNIGMDSLELYALELPAGTYSLDEMYDPSCSGCGYMLLVSFPFGEQLGTFSGQPGDVVMLGTVYVHEQFRKYLSSRPAEQNLEAQAKLVRDAFPNLDFDAAIPGWESMADDADTVDAEKRTTLIRGAALGFHGPLILENGDLAVGTNGGMVKVFRGLTDEIILDTGMTSGPVLAIAEPAAGTLVATSGAEMRQYDEATRSWVDVEHNLPDGFIENLIEYEDGYIAVVRSMVTSYVAKGKFGEPWQVIASTPSYEIPTPSSEFSLNRVTTTQEVVTHNAQRVGDRLFVYVGEKVMWEVDLNTGTSLTSEFPRAPRSFGADDEGLFSCRCAGPLLGFNHPWASPFVRDVATKEWTKLPVKLGSTDILSDVVVGDDGDTFYVVDRLNMQVGTSEEFGQTEIYSGGHNLETDKPVFSFAGHHRYASRFQNGPGIYVTNYMDALAFSLDNGETWELLKTNYFLR